MAVAACDASELSLTYELGFVNSAEPWWSAQLSCEASLALPLAFAYLLLMAPLAVLLLRSAWRERARHPEPPSDAADAHTPLRPPLRTPTSQPPIGSGACSMLSRTEAPPTSRCTISQACFCLSNHFPKENYNNSYKDTKRTIQTVYLRRR